MTGVDADLATLREALAIGWPEGDHAEPHVFTEALDALARVRDSLERLQSLWLAERELRLAEQAAHRQTNEEAEALAEELERLQEPRDETGYPAWSGLPNDPLVRFTSASWHCPVCDRRGDVHDERCLVLELVTVARRRKDGNRRLVVTNGRLRARVEAAEKELAEGPLSYPITGGYVLIDRGDLALIEAYKWSIQNDGRGKEFALATCRATGKKRSVRMHRLILDATEGQLVDHVNGNTLDNRRSNLRLATAADNQRNKDHAESESGYKGVHKKKRGGWDASLSVGGVPHRLGSYASPAEAALVRDLAALELHGEFASTNYPTEVLQRIVTAEARLGEALDNGDRLLSQAGRALEVAEARCARLTEENERLDGLRALYLQSADDWSERCARLQQALRELRAKVVPSLLAVKGHLETPYVDDERWTPWTRFVEPCLYRFDEVLGAAFAGPGSEQSSLTESGSAGLPDTPADSQPEEPTT